MAKAADLFAFTCARSANVSERSGGYLSYFITALKFVSYEIIMGAPLKNLHASQTVRVMS